MMSICNEGILQIFKRRHTMFEFPAWLDHLPCCLSNGPQFHCSPLWSGWHRSVCDFVLPGGHWLHPCWSLRCPRHRTERCTTHPHNAVPHHALSKVWRLDSISNEQDIHHFWNPNLCLCSKHMMSILEPPIRLHAWRRPQKSIPLSSSLGKKATIPKCDHDDTQQEPS